MVYGRDFSYELESGRPWLRWLPVDSDPDAEVALAADGVAEAAAQQQQATKGQHVAADHPALRGIRDLAGVICPAEADKSIEHPPAVHTASRAVTVGGQDRKVSIATNRAALRADSSAAAIARTIATSLSSWVVSSLPARNTSMNARSSRVSGSSSL